MIDRTRHGEPREPHVIEEEIEETRSSLEATFDELHSRLSSQALMDRVFSYTRSAGADFGGGLADTVRYNPVPTVLTSVGLAWLMASSRHRGNGYGARTRGDGLRERTRHAGDRMSHGARNVRDSARSGAEHLRESTERAGERLREGGERTRERLERAGANARDLFEEQPLLVGALAVAVGATLGALLPPTEAEDRYFGDISDRTREHAMDTAESKVDEATERVSERVAGEEHSSGTRPGGSGTPSTGTPRPESHQTSAGRSPSTPHP
ncbi:MAG TPA: DUF3618 domain-containing protein [Steroidobacteraceae bacterium]|nr:DUF3618 domain-containing protein [Steroidobacteraceae bacterium]